MPLLLRQDEPGPSARFALSKGRRLPVLGPPFPPPPPARGSRRDRRSRRAISTQVSARGRLNLAVPIGRALPDGRRRGPARPALRWLLPVPERSRDGAEPPGRLGQAEAPRHARVDP